MLPARFAPILFGFLLSGIMSCIVCGIVTLREVGLDGRFTGSWLGAWGFSWPIAFCTVLVVAPTIRRLVSWVVKS